MTSILNEITELRKGKPLAIDYKNSNRYRVVVLESDGSKTAYYFTAPIYNVRTRKAVDMKFFCQGSDICATGSNADITIGEMIRLKNSEGACCLSLAERTVLISDHEVACGKGRFYPTTNGIAIRSACRDEIPYTFSIDVSKPFMEVRANDRCFALMSEKFRPFVAISCIGTEDASGNVIAPARISYQKLTDRKYTITVTSCSKLGKAVLLEANLYEPKLFQDTTVESMNPKTNNAFGGIGFLGTTKEYGEQWLYTRPDFSKMPELSDKKILHAILHLPRLNRSNIQLNIAKASARFCSFGSTWENKIAELTSLPDPQIAGRYIDLDLTKLITDKYGRLTVSDGLILKAKKKDFGFSVIATADNYLFPQIFEINYR